MQIVNGYICMNCCDVDKARLGEDPHQQANQIQKQLKGLFDNPASASAEPAVTFGDRCRHRVWATVRIRKARRRSPKGLAGRERRCASTCGLSRLRGLTG